MGSDDTPAPDVSRLTPEEKRGPRTIHVAVFLLTALLIVSVVRDPSSILPRDSTLAGEHHVDTVSGLELAVPVGWRVSRESDFGSVQIVPSGSGRDPDTRILAGKLASGDSAAAFDDVHRAADALAETVQLYVMGVHGSRDDVRVADVSNAAGEGMSISFVVVPSEHADADAGGLIYVAVFGTHTDRWWVAYVTSSQGSAPGPRWMDRIVSDVRLSE